MVLAPRGTKNFGLGRFERSSSYELAPLLDLMKMMKMDIRRGHLSNERSSIACRVRIIST